MTRIPPRWECAFCCLLLVIAPGLIEASSKVSVSAGGSHLRADELRWRRLLGQQFCRRTG